MKLSKEFFIRGPVTQIARELLGKIIFTHFDNELTAGIINETEAYAGAIDRASHAYNNRRTSRTETMYKDGGIAYIYLCYGMHHLFNFVTHKKNIPEAVLLRGIYPFEGLKTMEVRRTMKFRIKGFTDGPGKVSQALGLSINNNGEVIPGNRIWVEDRGIIVNESDIVISPRIGVDYAKEDALLPYRYLLKNDSIKKSPTGAGL
ncbi:MAG: DNA-3-methyladenine glycosylase [Bacteroidales bacterium]